MYRAHHQCRAGFTAYFRVYPSRCDFRYGASAGTTTPVKPGTTQPNATRPNQHGCNFRQEYQDGDSEDLPEDEAFSILLPLPFQSATTAPSSTKVPAVEFQAIVAGAAAPAAALSTIGGAGAVGGGSGAPGADELDFLPTPARSVKKQKKKKRRKGGSNADDGRVEQEPAAAAAVAMAVAAGSGGGRSGPSSQKKGKHVGAGRVEDKMGVVSNVLGFARFVDGGRKRRAPRCPLGL